MIEWFLQLPPPTKISILALSVALISLLLSLFRVSFDLRLTNAQKRAELMIKLQEVVKNLKKTRKMMEATKPKRKDCTEKTKNELQSIKTLIEKTELLYLKLKRLGGFIGTVELQLAIPDVIQQIYQAETLIEDADQIRELCENCPFPDTQECMKEKLSN